MTDVRICSLHDIQRLVHRRRRIFYCLASLGFLSVAFIFSLFDPKYRADATFFEASEYKISKDPLRSLLGGADLIGASPQAAALIKSQEVLRGLVERLGLQLEIQEESFFLTMVHRLFKHVRADLGKKLIDSDEFVFENSHFEGEKSIHYLLSFHSDRNFSLYNSAKKTVVSGEIGKEVSFIDLGFSIKFTMRKAPERLQRGKNYLLRLDPWFWSVKAIVKDLQITVDKANSSFYRLSFFHKNRRAAVCILNELMREYHSYLERSHSKIALAQIDYLHEKQNQILKNLSEVFQDHSKYLESNIENVGISTFSGGSQGAFQSYELMEQKMMNLDLELAKLDALIAEEFCLNSLGEGLFFQKLADITDEIRELKKERDPLENYLIQQNSSSTKTNFFAGIDLKTARSLLEGCIAQMNAGEVLQKQYRQIDEEMDFDDFEISSLSSLLTDALSQNLISQAVKLRLLLQDEKHHSDKEGLRWKDELSLQKKILKSHLEQLSKVQDIHIGLHREKMAELRKTILSHIDQRISLLKQQVKEAVLERKSTLSKEKEILQEKMLNFRLRASREYPEKWQHEQWLTYKAELGTKMMTTLTELVESKTMAHRLHHIESRPLDFAVLPLRPEKSGLFAWATLASFGFLLIGFGYLFLKKLRSGFPASIERMQSLQYPVSGKIPFHCDGPFFLKPEEEDVESFRRMALFLSRESSDTSSTSKSNVVSLILGEGPDYSYAFATHLSLRYQRIVMIRCDFLKRRDSQMGLVQVWEKEICDIPIRKEKSFDVIDTGGVSLYGLEIIQSPFFSNLLEQVRQDYDCVLLVFQSPLKSAESEAALDLCDKAIVTIAEEALEDLFPFTHRSCYGKKNGLTFIFSG